MKRQTFKTFLLCTCICIALLVLYLTFHFRVDIIDTYTYSGRPEAEKQFAKSLRQFVRSDKQSIALKELTSFEWEKVYWFAPYSPDRSWKGDCDLVSHSVWGIQFVDSKGFTRSFCLEGGLIGYPDRPARCFLRKDTIVKIEKIPYGKKREGVFILQFEGSNCEGQNGFGGRQ